MNPKSYANGQKNKTAEDMAQIAQAPATVSFLDGAIEVETSGSGADRLYAYYSTPLNIAEGNLSIRSAEVRGKFIFRILYK